MQALRELCEELTSQRGQQDLRRVLQEYEQKIERLRKCASEIHATLQPPVGGTSKNKLVLHNSYAWGRGEEGRPAERRESLLQNGLALNMIKMLSLVLFSGFMTLPLFQYAILIPSQGDREHI